VVTAKVPPLGSVVKGDTSIDYSSSITVVYEPGAAAAVPSLK
jgi:hypothetical protein